MLKMLVCPLLNDATMRLGSLLTRSTDEGIPISRKQCREDVVGVKKIKKKIKQIQPVRTLTSKGP